MHSDAERPVLLFGSTGQIGGHLAPILAALGPLATPTRAIADFDRPSSLQPLVERLRPRLIVNAAAYTAVDDAEREPERAARINAEAPRLLAGAAGNIGAAMIHFSTDYVFDGTKRGPYTETDVPNPLGVYGKTKLAGDEAVLAAGGAAIVIRTSWVYGATGKNFMRRILELARTDRELRVVDDQIGAPTPSAAIARAVGGMLGELARSAEGLSGGIGEKQGLYNLSASGETSWFGFAREILARDPHAAEHRFRGLTAIATEQFGAPAKRPANSRLDNSLWRATLGTGLGHWAEELEGILPVNWSP